MCDGNKLEKITKVFVLFSIRDLFILNVTVTSKDLFACDREYSEKTLNFLNKLRFTSSIVVDDDWILYIVINCCQW